MSSPDDPTKRKAYQNFIKKAFRTNSSKQDRNEALIIASGTGDMAGVQHLIEELDADPNYQ